MATCSDDDNDGSSGGDSNDNILKEKTPPFTVMNDGA